MNIVATACRARYGRGGRRQHVDPIDIELLQATRARTVIERTLRRYLWVDELVRRRALARFNRAIENWHKHHGRS